MTLHTTFYKGAGGSAAALTVVDTNEDKIQDFENAGYADMIAILAAHSAPAVLTTFLSYNCGQWADYLKCDIIPLCQNDAMIDVAENYFPVGTRRMSTGNSHVVTGTSGGSDMFSVGLLLSYGKKLPGYDPNKPVFYRRYVKGADVTANAWTSLDSVDDLDPLKTYVCVGMQGMAEDAALIGIRTVVPSTGCHVGVVPGNFVWFPEGAFISNGKAEIDVQAYAVGASQPTAVLAFQEVSSASQRSATSGGMQIPKVRSTGGLKSLGSIGVAGLLSGRR